MKNEDFLDQLFEKARHAQDVMPPGDILDKGLNVTKTNMLEHFRQHAFKISIAAVACLALIFAAIQLNKPATTQTPALDQTANGKQTGDALSSMMDSTFAETQNSDSLSSLSQNKTGLSGQQEFSYKSSSVNDKSRDMDRNTEESSKKKPLVLKGNIDKLLKMQEMPMQTYEIDCSKDTVLIAEQGSKFHIESYTFRNHQNQVIQGKATIQIKECYTPYSFMRENLSTCSDSNTLLETGGMYYVNALQGKDTLSIRKGFEIGITPNYKVPDRMNLYYGKRDNAQNLNWEIDSLGKKETPLFISTDGKYSRVMNHFFHKNYKLDKKAMLELQDTYWHTHFTSDQRKVLGHTNCDSKDGVLKSACEEFTALSHVMAKSDTFNVNSRFTDFRFDCISKNKYAYYQSLNSFDTFRAYVPASDYRNIRIPDFFAISTGWLNLDCVPTIDIRYKKFNIIPKNDVVIKLPEDLRANAVLYLPEQGSVARTININRPELTFTAIPKNQKGLLVITSLINDIFYVYSKEIDTDDFIDTEIKFDKIYDFDAYMAWLKKTTETVNMMATLPSEKI